MIWEFPKIRGTLLWVLIIRILLFGYYIRVPWSLIFGSSHVAVVSDCRLRAAKPSTCMLLRRIPAGMRGCCRHAAEREREADRQREREDGEERERERETERRSGKRGKAQPTDS